MQQHRNYNRFCACIVNSITGANSELIGLKEISKGEAELAGVGVSVGVHVLCKHIVMM